MTDMILVYGKATPSRRIVALTGALLRKTTSSWRKRKAGHQALLLSDRMLDDIGLNRCMLVHHGLTVETF